MSVPKACELGVAPILGDEEGREEKRTLMLGFVERPRRRMEAMEVEVGIAATGV